MVKCVKCVCVCIGVVKEVGGVDKRIGFRLYQPVGTVVVLDVYMCVLGCGGVSVEWAGLGGVMSVFVVSLDY